MKVTVPQSAVLLLELEVTVAISVTPWLVTAAVGDDSNEAVVGCEAAGVGAAITVAVLLLFAGVLPPRPLAVTTQ
ncbi:MAG: MYXO-CTERM sorting domain-containing protein [Solirubrobacteraceae bacterium]